MTHPVRPPSRRAVLTAGAWTAPAVVVATAAPAYAGGSNTPPLVTTAVSTAYGQATINMVLRNYLDITCVFTNQNAGPTTAMTASVEIAPTTGKVFSLLPYELSAGWTFNTGTRTTGDGAIMTFTRNAPQLGGAPASVTLFYRAWMDSPGTSGLVRATPSPTPGVGTPGATEFPETLPIR